MPRFARSLVLLKELQFSKLKNKHLENMVGGGGRDLSPYTANAYRQTTDKLMFKSVISTVR